MPWRQQRGRLALRACNPARYMRQVWADSAVLPVHCRRTVGWASSFLLDGCGNCVHSRGTVFRESVTRRSVHLDAPQATDGALAQLVNREAPSHPVN